jgi:hypothetical protein
MNTSAPPVKERGELLHAPKAAVQLQRRFRILALFQVARRQIRWCVVCNCSVTNDNLGGYDGRSALTGELYCLRCADGRDSGVMGFGGTQ